jgi:AraC-like DNA-binding protein
MSIAVIQSGHIWPHKHWTLSQHRNNGLELVYISRGNVRWLVDGAVELSGPGSIFYTMPWETHGGLGESMPGCDLYFLIIPFERNYTGPRKRYRLSPSLGLRLADYECEALSMALNTNPTHRTDVDSLTKEAFRVLVAELGRNPISEAYCRALLTSILTGFIRGLTSGEQTAGTGPDTRDRVRAFLRALVTRCAEPWTLDAMAVDCSLHRTQFTNLVRTETGDNPIQFLNRLRIDKAKVLLMEDAHTITDIAFECGFQTSQYFAKVFRDYTHKSPLAYRRTARREGLSTTYHFPSRDWPT